MEGDIVQMGAYIGAGLACTGMGGAAVGVGHVVGNFIAERFEILLLQLDRRQQCSLVLLLLKLWASFLF